MKVRSTFGWLMNVNRNNLSDSHARADTCDSHVLSNSGSE